MTLMPANKPLQSHKNNLENHQLVKVDLSLIFMNYTFQLAV